MAEMPTGGVLLSELAMRCDSLRLDPLCRVSDDFQAEPYDLAQGASRQKSLWLIWIRTTDKLSSHRILTVAIAQLAER